MRCANPDCCSALFDQPGGSLWMMGLETSSREIMDGEDNGFPISLQNRSDHSNQTPPTPLERIPPSVRGSDWSPLSSCRASPHAPPGFYSSPCRISSRTEYSALEELRADANVNWESPYAYAQPPERNRVDYSPRADQPAEEDRPRRQCMNTKHPVTDRSTFHIRRTEIQKSARDVFYVVRQCPIGFGMNALSCKLRQASNRECHERKGRRQRQRGAAFRGSGLIYRHRCRRL